MSDGLMTVPEIAAYLAKSTRWVYREARSWGVPLYKIGDSLRARKKELDAWIDQQRAS